MDREDHIGNRCFGSGWRWARLPFAALLVLGTTFAYYPAMDRVFAADQIGYFSELQGETSLASGLRLLDYGAHRQYSRGDEASYRPLLFGGLALGNAVFRRDFRAWNLANLGVHMAVSWLLFEVLWRMGKTPLAGGVALWFALLASNFELVTWNHLGGYMAGYGLLLAALWAARNMAEDGSSLRWCWLYGIAMTGAMLEHEIAVVASFGALAYVLWFRRGKSGMGERRWQVAMGAPIAMYAVLYGFHVFQCERLFWVNSPGEASPILERAWAVPVLIGRWAQHILLPREGQLAFSGLRRSAWTSGAGPWTFESLAIGLLWLGTWICLVRGFSRKRWRETGPFAGLVFVLVVGYAALNLTGRPTYAMQVPYYDYFPALMGAAGIYSLIDVSRVGRRGIAGALACLFLLAAINGWHLRRISCRMQEMNRPVARYLEWVEQTVRPRLTEPGFSFAVQGVPPELDLTGPLVFGYPDRGATVPVPLLHFLYGKYYNSATPSDRFVYPAPNAEFRGSEPGGVRPD